MKVRADSKPSKNVGTRSGEIYQCAAELIVQKGFGHATTAEIARRMKMTKAGLYYYISSKAARATPRPGHEAYAVDAPRHWLLVSPHH